jgi:predicted DNA binding CopG/RHH family protein
MAQSNPTNIADTTIPVSSDLQAEIRVAKAESGMSYDEYLREQLALSE